MPTLLKPKLYISSNISTQMSLELVRPDWAIWTVVNISVILLNYPTFERYFFILSRAEQMQNKSFCTF
jgi:hypothetical protein